MADFITMTCKSCGGKLQITPEIEDFACMYCGTEFKVKREGGIVALSPLVDEMKKVSVSTDKTASELAIARIRTDINTLFRDQETAEKEVSDLIIKRKNHRDELISEINVTRNSIIFILVISSFVGAIIFSVFILDLGPIICTGIAIIIIAIALYLAFNKNFRDFTGKKRLQNYDNVTENITRPLINNNETIKTYIQFKKSELEKHEKIVGG